MQRLLCFCSTAEGDAGDAEGSQAVKVVTAVVDAGGEEEAVVAQLGIMAIGELPCFSRRKEGSCCPRLRGNGGSTAGSNITKCRRGLGSTKGGSALTEKQRRWPFLLEQDGAWWDVVFSTGRVGGEETTAIDDYDIRLKVAMFRSLRGGKVVALFLSLRERPGAKAARPERHSYSGRQRQL
ncbi:hypothetical protein GW17_00017556 [Ensete ventricosum]|nr:hypothetical protein GW17_00017556 [Ensete ventricosum]